MPKGMVLGTLAGCFGSLVLFLIFGVSGLIAAVTLKKRALSTGCRNL